MNGREVWAGMGTGRPGPHMPGEGRRHGGTKAWRIPRGRPRHTSHVPAERWPLVTPGSLGPPGECAGLPPALPVTVPSSVLRAQKGSAPRASRRRGRWRPADEIGEAEAAPHTRAGAGVARSALRTWLPGAAPEQRPAAMTHSRCTRGAQGRTAHVGLAQAFAACSVASGDRASKQPRLVAFWNVPSPAPEKRGDVICDDWEESGL